MVLELFWMEDSMEELGIMDTLDTDPNIMELVDIAWKINIKVIIKNFMLQLSNKKLGNQCQDFRL